MSTYVFTLGAPTQVTWVDASGQTRTESFAAGEQVEFTDACEAYRFIQAGTQSTNRPYVANDDGAALGAIRAACEGRPSPRTVLDQADGVSAPPAGPPPGEPGDDTPGDPPSVNPPQEAASPETVAAPPPPPAIVSASGPPVPGVPDGRTVEERAHDPRAPASEADVADDIAAGAVLGDDVERVRRNDPTPGLPHYHFGRNDTPTPQVLAEPVDAFSGDFLLEQADLTIPGRRRPLRFVRRYRSGVPHFGPWGFNWDHNYTAHVRPLDEGWVAVWTGLLNEDVYEPHPQRGWTPPLGVTVRLEHQAAGSAGPERWVVRAVDGTEHRFERPAGWPRPDRFPLVEVRDRFGNAERLTYATDGTLAAVTDDLGRRLVFHYGGCGLLEGLSDHTGRTVRYEHDPQRQHLAAVVEPATDEAPDGTRTCYEYDDNAAHPRLRHNLVRIVAADGCTVVANTYGKDPSSDDFARVVEQAYAQHRAAFRATRLATPARLPDAVNLPARQVEVLIDGRYQLLTFNFRGDLLEERYRLVADGSWRLVVEAFRYDERGNQVLLRRPNGLTVHQIFDTANADPSAWANLLEVRLEAPPSRPATGRRTVRMTYEPRYQMLRTFEDESGATTRYGYGHEIALGGVPALARVEHPDTSLPDATVQHAVTRVDYNRHGQVVRLTSPAGRVTELRYGTAGDEAGYVVERIRDPAGVAATERFAYDEHGNARSVTDAEGNTATLVFDARNRLVRATKPSVSGVAPEIRLRYHLDGHLAELRRPRGLALGLAAGETDIVTTYEYDVLGRLVRQVEGTNATVPRERRFAYDADNRLTAIVDPLGRQETMTFDERGALVARVATGDGSGRELRFVRDLNGEVTATVLPGGARIDWTRDSWDRLRSQEEPGPRGGRTLIAHTYIADDLLVGSIVEGPTGVGSARGMLASRTSTYDERGRVLTEDDGSGPPTMWYDADGLRTAVVDSSGARTVFNHDALGRLVEIVDAAGNRHTFEYDRDDRLIEEVLHYQGAAGGASSHTVRRAYDAQGRQTLFVDGTGRATAYSYDAAGRLVSVSGADGSVELRYNPFGELIETSVVVGGAPTVQRLERDAAGRFTGFTDATAAHWGFELDAFDQIVRRVHPDGSEDRYTFGDHGHLEEVRTPGGSRIIYGRRPDGALVTVDVVAAGASLPVPATQFTRDGLGRCTRAVQGTSTVERRYDAAGRIVRESVGAATIERSYDDTARTERLTYSDGRRDRREFDALHRLVRVVLEQPGAATATAAWPIGTAIATWHHEGVARLVGRELVTGNRLRARYDAGQRLVELAHTDAAGTVLARLTYLRDAAGRRRVLRIEGDPWRDHVYVFDALGRLERAVEGVALGALPDPADPAAVDAFLAALPAAPAGVVDDAYGLDGADTRRSWTRTSAAGSITRTYAVDVAHRLRAVAAGRGPAQPVTHDSDGRRDADGRLAYSHDALGRLREVRSPATGAVLATLEWDALGRLERVVGSAGDAVDLRYIGDEVLERATSDGQVVQETPGFLPAEAPLRVGPAGPVAYLEDDRGSALALADATGAPTRRHRYEDFGAVSAWDGAGLAPLSLSGLLGPARFAGMEHLVAADLYLAGPRVYDPHTGRFLQPDPEGIVDSPDPYAYVKHNPVDGVDASGRLVETAWDVFSFGVGVASLTHNLTQDEVDWWAVGLDVAGLAADLAALFLPGVPGGISVAIKAVRTAGKGVQVVTNVGRLGRGVRAAQAAVGVVNAVRGGFQSYEAAREGHYVSAALGVGLSAIGLRSSLSRFHLATASRPARLFSMQGSRQAIVQSERIWGQTEGRVWASRRSGGGLFWLDVPDVEERVIFEFRDQAASLFRPVTVWGPITGVKALIGEFQTEVGDLFLTRLTRLRWDGNLESVTSIVSEAFHLSGIFAGQSALAAWRRASFPLVVDTGVNLVIASFPALAGAGPRTFQDLGLLHPPIAPDPSQLRESQPQK